MDKIKRFVTCLIPVHACNFRCTYCYLSHHVDKDVYGGGIKPFAALAQDVAAYFSVERMGGPCYFNLCAAGETMMHPELNDFIVALTKNGHYADIITNGTLTSRFEDLISKLDERQRKHLFIKFSFHYLELQKLKMMKKFIDNVIRIKDAGISYSIEITPHDDLVPYIDEIKEFSMREFGAWPHITVARNEGTKEIGLLTKFSREKYKKIWSQFDSEMFNFKLSIFNEKRCEFCYAGLWSISVILETGNYMQCYGGDVLGNFCDLSKPVHFRAMGKCREPHCFNGHAFLALGDIPELGSPYYYEERDRVTDDGVHWFQPETKEFFSSKLSESNEQYTEKEKKKILIKNKGLYVVNKGKRACQKLVAIVKKK